MTDLRLDSIFRILQNSSKTNQECLSDISKVMNGYVESTHEQMKALVKAQMG
jgi:hypothetical protein